MLKEIIDQFYRESHKDFPQTHFYVSDAGKCPRYIFFKFKQAPRRDYKPRILRLFDHGDAIHRMITKALSDQGILRGEEVTVPSPDFISGRADAIIKIGNERYVVDIKSMNSHIFRKLKEPRKTYRYQLQLYLHFLEIKRGILLYVNKNTQALKERYIEYDPELCENLLDSFKDLKKKIEKDIVPPRLDHWPSNKQCRYCRFKEVCSMIGEGELPWADFKEKIQTQAENIKNGKTQENLFSKSE